MKRKSVTVVSLILSMLMIMSVFSVVSVSAEVVSGTDEAHNITWEWDSDTKTLTINGEGDYPVYEYPYNMEPWFDLCAHDAETLILGEGFTSIPQMAFSTPYSDVVALKLPDSLRTIGNGAFSNMYSLEDIDFGNGVETIGGGAFQYTGLWTVKLPDSVRTIEGGAFDNCTELFSVDLGNGVETIGGSAFSDTAIKSVTIPDSVTSIGKCAFGYYYNEWYNKEGNVVAEMSPRRVFEIHASADNAVAEKYAKDNGFTFCTGDPYVTPEVTVKAGGTKKLTVKNVAMDYWGGTDSSIAIARDGVVYGFKKGTCKVIGISATGGRYVVKVTVTTNPKITIGGKAYKAGKTYSVKKGKKLAVKITGKSVKAKNKYSSSKPKVAKVVSKTTATTANIKGYKKGTTTIKIVVNGVTFKFKVKVK